MLRKNKSSGYAGHWGSKPVQVNNSVSPYLKNYPLQKRAGGVAQGEGPEFKPQYCKNKQNSG
jgi:hypothetical protein